MSALLSLSSDPPTRILVVEDEAIVALDIEMTLQQLGYRVLETLATGEAAVERARVLEPDVVLMDIQLRGTLNGIDAAEILKRDGHAPVIFLTAHADTKTLERAKLSEPFGYVVKPFEERELHTAIEIAIARHQVERRLQQAISQEQELRHLKNRLVSAVSHEFRTPLTAIRSTVELLEVQGRRSGRARDRQAKLYRRVYRGVERMVDLLDNLLLVGQLENGETPFRPEPLDLAELCREVASELETPGSPTPIRVECAADVPVASGDRELLWRVLANLLSNAIKYSPDGGEVTLTLAREGDEVLLQVRDRGIGIPPEDQKRLFEFFYRGGNAGRIPGTGLGLSVVRQCVERHGGQIEVESVVGEGSTFAVRLPLEGVPESPSEV